MKKKEAKKNRRTLFFTQIPSPYAQRKKILNDKIPRFLNFVKEIQSLAHPRF
jgi:hypothetical protein